MKKPIFFLSIFFSFFIHSNHFVLISAPGSGKGTFSQYMIQNHGYIQICPGDLFRKEILQQTDFGKQIQPIVESGQYVDEEIVCNLMKQYIEDALYQNKNFILDGFPRSEIALNFLLHLFEKLQINTDVTFIQFCAQDNICIQRILGRMVCDTCQKVYHKDFFEINQFCCVDCGVNLSVIKADQEKIALERLVHFHEIVEPLLSNVQNNYNVITINSNQSVKVLEGLYDELVV